jgi:hypothetical protein
MNLPPLSPLSARCLPAIGIAHRSTLKHHRLWNSSSVLPGDALFAVLGTRMSMVCNDFGDLWREAGKERES